MSARSRSTSPREVLVDEALQDRVADRLDDAGHDATHARALRRARPTTSFAYAAREQRLLITTNTDFGTILALSGVAGPSVLLLRGVGDPVDKRVDAVIHACQSSSGS